MTLINALEIAIAVLQNRKVPSLSRKSNLHEDREAARFLENLKIQLDNKMLESNLSFYHRELDNMNATPAETTQIIMKLLNEGKV